MSSTTAERPVAQRDTDEPVGQDPEKGKLFEVPRVAVAIDDSDPTILKISFSGQIELERGNASDVEFYNKLAAGQTIDLGLSCHVPGRRQRIVVTATGTSTPSSRPSR